MSEFKLPPPRRLLRCDIPHHDDALIERDVLVFDEIATIESSFDAPDLLLVVDELVDEMANSLTISLTLIAEVDDGVAETRIAEVA